MAPITVERLCSAFGIEHPLKHSTCIGYGTAKPNCRNPVAAASRNAAITELERVCNALEQGRSDDSRLMEKLDNAAHLLHCKRNHQYQAEPMADEWFKSLSNYLASQRERAERRRQRAERQRASAPRARQDSSRTSASSSTRSSLSSRQNLSHASDKDLLKELTLRLQSRGRLLDSIDELVRSHHHEDESEESISDSEDEAGSDDLYGDSGSENVDSDYEPPVRRRHTSTSSRHHHTSHRSTDEVPHENSARQRRSPAPSPSQHSHSSTGPVSSHASSAPSEGSSTSSRHIRTPSTSSSSSPSHHTRSTSASSTTSTSEAECGVCLSELPRGDSDVWRCTTCRNATHVECFGAWMANSQGSVTCIYCRAEVDT